MNTFSYLFINKVIFVHFRYNYLGLDEILVTVNSRRKVDIDSKHLLYMIFEN